MNTLPRNGAIALTGRRARHAVPLLKDEQNASAIEGSIGRLSCRVTWGAG